jgi:mannose-6-phosphate isomerase
MAILPMLNSVRTYDWGSVGEIPRLTGIDNPDGTPMAELWMGAHPGAPSRVRTGGDAVPLPSFIERDPDRVLGPDVAARFGGRLPFLFKILSAAKALSIQAHPSPAQARAGFERENEAGIPLDAFERCYKDDNHKPELIRAVTAFWALRGFRRYGAIAEDFAGEEFAFLADAVAGLLSSPGPEALRRFFSELMAAEPEVVAGAACARARAARGSAGASAGDGAVSPARARYEWVERLAEQFGEDRGVAAPLYLNCLRLEPGEAMFLPAGTLHAYLEGTGIEVMASSDNVLRGGLTRKHVDVAELTRTLAFAPDEPVLQPGPRGADARSRWHRYETPVSEFVLEETVLGDRVVRERARSVPEVLLVLEGSVRITELGSASAPDEQRLSLPPGGSAFVTADTGSYELAGSARVFVAAVAGGTAGANPAGRADRHGAAL